MPEHKKLTLRERFILPSDSLLYRVNLAVLVLALTIITLSLAQTIYRLSLPMDGWSFVRDNAGTGQSLVYDQNISGLPSALIPGDRLLAVDGRPYVEILADALTSKPHLSLDWFETSPIYMSVVRYGRISTVHVHLVVMPAEAILRSTGRHIMMNPGPLVMLMVALFVFLRQPRIPAARLLLVFGAAVFASDGISQGVTGTNVVGPAELFYLGAYWPAQFFNSLIWPLVIAPIFVHLALCFPVVKLPLRRYPRLTIGVMYGFAPLMILIGALASSGSPLKFLALWTQFNTLQLLVIPVVAILIMTHTLLTTRSVEKRVQILWVAAGTLVTSIGALSGGILVSMGLVNGSLWFGWFITRMLELGFPLTLAVAILRYRLFDIDVIVHRTLVYGMLSVLLGLVYFSSVILINTFFRLATGQNSTVTVAISTLTIAALFSPLRGAVQNFIDRRFYRKKYDAARILETFSTGLRDSVDLGTQVKKLLDVTAETIHPQDVSLWIKTTRTAPGGKDDHILSFQNYRLKHE